jgi:hypothetical protein
MGIKLVAPLAAGESLDRARALHRAFVGTKPQVEAAIDAIRDRRSALFGELFRIPNIAAGIYRALGTDSLRRLTIAGLDLRTEALRTGRYPDALPAEHLAPEPFLGSILLYRRQADGSAFLEVPGAEKSWKELSPRLTETFRWTLPPPRAPR